MSAKIIEVTSCSAGAGKRNKDTPTTVYVTMLFDTFVLFVFFLCGCTNSNMFSQLLIIEQRHAAE